MPRSPLVSSTTRSKKLSDFQLHRQEKFLYTIDTLDQWEESSTKSGGTPPVSHPLRGQ